MMTLQKNLEDTTLAEAKRAQRAFRLSLVGGLTIVLAGLVIFIRLLVEGTINSDLIQPGVGIIAGVICLVAAFLAKRQHVTASVVLGVVALFSMDLFLIINLSEIGFPLTIILTITLILTASQTLPPHQVTYGVIAIFALGSLLLLLDLFWPFERGTIASADLQIIYLGSLIVIGLGLFVAIRQFPTFSLRTKLISVAISLVIITVLLTTVVVNSVTRRTLTAQLNQEFNTVSQSQAATISELLGRQVEVAQTLSLDSGLSIVTRGQNARYTGSDEEILVSILTINERWLNDPEAAGLINSYTNNTAATALKNFQRSFPDHAQISLTDKYGALVGATKPTTDYYQADEVWWQEAYNNRAGSIYIGEPAFDESSGVIVINIAVPILNLGQNEVIGILRTSYELTQLTELLKSASSLGTSRHIDLLFNNFAFHAEDGEVTLEATDIDPALLEELRSADQNVIDNIDGEESLIHLAPITTIGHIPAVDNLGWSILVSQPEDEAFAAVRTQEQISIVLALVAIVLGSIMAGYFARLLTGPINRLTDTAVLIADGDLNRRAPVETQDEIGTLANAFNNMTTQLRTFIGTLEERVTLRTQALSTSSEVSRQLSTILDQDALVNEVVNQIRDSFNYYHAQIYLYDDQKEYLMIAGGTGQAGRELLVSRHKLGPNQGLVGRAAATNQVVLIADISKDSTWLANDLLPDTKSEAAIPIALGDDVLGVLDVQHNIADGLDQESTQLLQSIANQVAIALQNARQVAQTKEALTESDRLYVLAEQQAQRLVELNEMSAAFNTVNTEDEIYQILGSRILTVLNGDYAAVSLLNANASLVDVIVLNGKDTAVTENENSENEQHGVNRFEMPAAGSLVAHAAQNTQLFYLPHHKQMAEFTDTQQLAQDGFQSMLAVPLQVGTKVLGTLNIVSKQAAAYEDANINFVQQIATTLATTLENQRVNQRANLLASIVENHPDFIGVGALTGHALYVNPSGLKMMGLSPDADVLGMEASTFYSAEDTELLGSEGIPTALETGVWAAEVGLLTHDGTSIPVEETIGINYDLNNQPTSFSITMRDIRERKQAEEAIRLSEQMARDFQEKLTKLHEISVELSQQEELADVFRKAIELGQEKLGFDRLALWMFDETVTTTRGTFGTAADGTVSDESHLQALIADDPWILPVIESRERRQVLHDANLVYDDEVVGRGWHITVILQQENWPLGWLAIDNLLNQRPLQPYEAELVSLFAATLASVIVNKRAETAVAKQAAELQAVAEVSRIATTILDQNEMLQSVVDLTKEQFNLYHAHIYLMSQNKESLILAAGAGAIGQEMVTEKRQISLRAQQSLVAQAARTRQGLIVNDVQAEAGFLAHPLLPETRAELAIPLIAGDEVLGVLDIQSSEVNYFSEKDITIQTTLAAQIATALQNATQYKRTQDALTELTRMQQLLIREGWDSFLTAKERPVQGYVYDQHEIQPIKKNDQPTPESTEKDTAVYSPLTVRGATIGTLGVRDPSGQPVSADKQRLLSSISQQVAEALERARLFEETEIARAELQENTSFLDSVIENLPVMLFVKEAENLSFIRWNKAGSEISGYPQENFIGKTDYDFFTQEEADFYVAKDREVLREGQILEIPDEPMQTAHQGTRTLHTRKVPINDAEGNPKYLLGISEDITERRQAEAALAKRAVELQTVAEISTSVGTTLDAQQILDEVVDLTWANFGLYHVNIYLFNEASSTLKLAASSGTIGDKMVAAGHTIPLDSKKSLVARAARIRQGVIVNDVESEEAYLANPMLPATRSEMTIPMLAGKQLMGVLDVQSEEVDHFSSQDINIQTTLASQIATALENARLFTQTQKRAAELSTINTINTVASAQLNMRSLLETVGDRLHETFKAQAVYIALYDEAQNVVSFPYFNDKEDGLIEMASKNLSNDGESFTAQIIQARQPLIVSTPSTEDALQKGAQVTGTGRLTDSFLGVPMILGDRLLGVIGMSAYKEEYVYTEDDKNLLMTLASTIGVALQNAQQFELAQRRADRERVVNEITQKIQNTLSVENALQTAVKELGQAFNAKNTQIELKLTKDSNPSTNGSS